MFTVAGTSAIELYLLIFLPFKILMLSLIEARLEKNSTRGWAFNIVARNCSTVMYQWISVFGVDGLPFLSGVCKKNIYPSPSIIMG